MRVNDIQPLTLPNAIGALGQQFRLERVGGQSRIYSVSGLDGAIYLIGGGPKAIGLAWSRGTNRLAHVYVWYHLNTDNPADFVADIPENATMAIMPQIFDFIKSPHTGAITEDSEPEPLKIQIMARRPNGELFEVPGTAKMAAAIEARLSSSSSDKSMEEQYEELKSKIRLVVSGKSHNIKSLLIYGAPSSGKTFSVMEVIKELGLQEGTDYVIKKGSITDAAAYRTFVQNIDGLIVFDDCDSVVETKVGKNMIKGALDTYPIRDLSYDNANAIDTDAMPTEERIEFVNSISRVLKGTPTNDDLARFDAYSPSKEKPAEKAKIKIDKDGNFELPDPEHIIGGGGTRARRIRELQEYFQRHMPNKIDFRGRMIFISNMGHDEWDSAILTRTFQQYMDFADTEMLDFIDRIKQHIRSGISEEQKQEVIDYIRDLYDSGRLKARVNFRLIQQAFDLRLTSNWRSMIADL